MEFSVAKPIMYFLALTVCPIFFFFLSFFCQTNSFMLLFHLSYACVAMEVLWSSQQQQRRRNDLGRQACAVSFTPTDSPEDHVQCWQSVQEWVRKLTQKPSHTRSMLYSQEGHKRGHQRKACSDLSFPSGFLSSLLKVREKICLNPKLFTGQNYSCHGKVNVLSVTFCYSH